MVVGVFAGRGALHPRGFLRGRIVAKGPFQVDAAAAEHPGVSRRDFLRVASLSELRQAAHAANRPSVELVVPVEPSAVDEHLQARKAVGTELSITLLVTLGLQPATQILAVAACEVVERAIAAAVVRYRAVVVISCSRLPRRRQI